MSDTSPDFARFLGRFALVLAVGVIAVVALVIAIDPYGIYGIVPSGRFNAVKPNLTRYQLEIKQMSAERMHPEFVILGNSRAEIGFDPKANAFQAMRGKGYNVAIAGTGTATSLDQLVQLQKAGIQPKTIILGVEFLDFVPAAGATVTAVSLPSDPAPGAPPAAPSGPSHWKFDALFSLASVKDALRTLAIQHDDEAATMDPDGLNPLKEYRSYVRNDGFHKIFAQRGQENARAFHRKSTTTLKPADLQRLQTFLNTAASMHADVKLVIYPYHAQIQAMFEQAGLWSSFENWKQQVLAAVVQAQSSHPGARIRLFDFSGFGAYNCERIPDPGEAGDVTRWYWEGGHFKKQLGDIVLARIMSPEAPQAIPFGFPLVPGSEQSNQDRIAAERRACLAAMPATFASARAVMERASY